MPLKAQCLPFYSTPFPNTSHDSTPITNGTHSFLAVSHSRAFARVVSVSKIICLTFDQLHLCFISASQGGLPWPTDLRIRLTVPSTSSLVQLSGIFMTHIPFGVIYCYYLFVLFFVCLLLKELAHESKGQSLTHHSIPHAQRRPSPISISTG